MRLRITRDDLKKRCFIDEMVLTESSPQQRKGYPIVNPGMDGCTTVPSAAETTYVGELIEAIKMREDLYWHTLRESNYPIAFRLYRQGLPARPNDCHVY